MDEIMSWPGTWWVDPAGWLMTLVVIGLVIRRATRRENNR